MENLFLGFLNRSIAAGWLILIVILLRLFLKKVPKSVRLLLWLMVAIRLICPVSFESVLSLIPNTETVVYDSTDTGTFQIDSGVEVVDQRINPVITEYFTSQTVPEVTMTLEQKVLLTASRVWIAGILVLLLYAAVSQLLLHRRVADSVPCIVETTGERQAVPQGAQSGTIGKKGNIRQSSRVTSPFVMGLFRPRIYLPFHMEEETMGYVIAHEQMHIRYFHHWVKWIGFLILTAYWFHPLVWTAYILLCRDIELACDEAVVSSQSLAYKKAYAQALLACSESQASLVSPLAFRETGIRQRIKNVLSCKKTAFWMMVLCVFLCMGMAACFLTNPKEPDQKHTGEILEETKDPAQEEMTGEANGETLQEAAPKNPEETQEGALAESEGNTIEKTTGETTEEDVFMERAKKLLEENRSQLWMGEVLGAERSIWFADYNGETWQVIESEERYTTPSDCNTIIYYQDTQNSNVDEIVVKMAEVLLEGMTEPSDLRPFTVMEYRIPQQKLYTLEDNLEIMEQVYERSLEAGNTPEEAWDSLIANTAYIDGFVPVTENMWYFVLNGYYSYEGLSGPGVSMEQEAFIQPELIEPDGLIPFVLQGSEGVFQFVLIKEGNVYRLQRAMGMKKLYEKMP